MAFLVMPFALLGLLFMPFGLEGIVLWPAITGLQIILAIAETIAGLIFVYLIDNNCRANLGTWPFVSDLRERKVEQRQTPEK